MPGSPGADRDHGRQGLGVTRKALSELVNGHSGVSPEMAIRLAKAFGGTAEAWLRLRVHSDVASAEKRSRASQ